MDSYEREIVGCIRRVWRILDREVHKDELDKSSLVDTSNHMETMVDQLIYYADNKKPLK